jgi:CheY-like chemotaxis protein
MKQKLKIWFIDDEGHVRTSIRECFGLKREYAEFKDDIFIKVLNSGKDGELAYKNLVKVSNTEEMPDVIFCDLRFHGENAIADPFRLGGVKLMKRIAELEAYKNTLILVFSQLTLSDEDKSNIQKLIGYGERVDSFINKVDLGFDSISLNKISNIKISKECDVLHAVVDLIAKKIRK